MAICSSYLAALAFTNNQLLVISNTISSGIGALLGAIGGIIVSTHLHKRKEKDGLAIELNQEIFNLVKHIKTVERINKLIDNKILNELNGDEIYLKLIFEIPVINYRTPPKIDTGRLIGLIPNESALVLEIEKEQLNTYQLIDAMSALYKILSNENIAEINRIEKILNKRPGIEEIASEYSKVLLNTEIDLAKNACYSAVMAKSALEKLYNELKTCASIYYKEFDFIKLDCNYSIDPKRQERANNTTSLTNQH